MENKKFSNYNIEYVNDDGILIYNTLSSGVLSLNKEYYSEYEKLKKYGECREDLFNELCKGGILVNEDLNESSMLNILSKEERFSRKNLSLTIAPTLACNFKCPYCYEKGVDMKSMDEETVNATVDFIKQNIDENSVLGIVWYGGEPLLAVNQIEDITRRLFKKIEGLEENFEANIVTNGYLLSKEVALKLKKCKVSHAQITLDGPPEIHNKRRILMDDRPTFDDIMSNIKDCCEIIKITIRVNVDKTNIDYINDIVLILKKNKIFDKVNLYIAPVDDINSEEKNMDCLNGTEFSEKEAMFLESNSKDGNPAINIPECNLGICGAVNLNSYVIDPEGKLYKCWDEIGRIESCVGNVFEGIRYNETFDFYMNYDILNGECEKCAFLPVCMGGCPYKRKILGVSQCFSLKYNVNDMLKRI